MFMNKKDKQKYNSMFLQILKRICKVPTSTPNAAILMETGYKNVTDMIEKRRLMYYRRIMNNEESNHTKNFMMKENNAWTKETTRIMEELNIDNIWQSKSNFKKEIDREQNIKWKKELENDTKSKINFLITNSERIITGRADYMKRLTRNEASNILKYRTRMMNVKSNYKQMYKNTTCRWCSLHEETQKHILEDCKLFPRQENSLLEYEIFNEDPALLKEASKILEEIYKELEKK